MIDFENLAQAMGDLDEETVVEVLEAVMAEGGADAPKAMEACQKGMDIVGKLFEEGEYRSFFQVTDMVLHHIMGLKQKIIQPIHVLESMA